MPPTNEIANSFPFIVEYAKSSRSTCNTTKESIAAGTLRIGVMTKSQHFDGFEPKWSKASAYLKPAKRSKKKKMPQSTDELGGFEDLRPADQERIEKYLEDYAKATKAASNTATSTTATAKEVKDEKAKKLAVREQSKVVWQLRDIITPKKTGVPTSVIKSILEANNIPTKGVSPADLPKILAETLLFGVPPVGNTKEGCCGSIPLRFSPVYCLYVCGAQLAWGPCPYNQPASETQCTAIAIPNDVKNAKKGKADWIQAAATICGDGFPPKERLFVARKNIPTPPHVAAANKKKQSPVKSKQTARMGMKKPNLSRACVDPESNMESGYHVLDEGYLSNGTNPDPKEAYPVDLYDTILCLTDLSTGVNSQYKLQILAPDNDPHGSKKQACYLWRVWGRVGGDGGGGNKLDTFNSLDEAKEEFVKLFKKRTDNEWSDRKSFTKNPGKFFQLDISYADDDDGDKKPAATQAIQAGDPNSKLPSRVQEVIASIFDKKLAAKQLESMNFDISKMPLGNITEAQLRDAYSVLTNIEKMLNETDAAAPVAAATTTTTTTAAVTPTSGRATRSSGRATRSKNSTPPAPPSPSTPNPAIKKGMLQQLSNQFYSKCPSTDPVLIDTMQILKEKVEMVDELINLQASSDVLKKAKVPQQAKAAIDEAYEKLNTGLTPLDPTGDEYNLLKTYVENTRNATAPGVSGWGGNDWGSRGLRLLDAFEVQRTGEAQRFEASKALGNRRLLWHGSRISNYIGILSQGLRIAPPEAPVSGYRFGKGVYFADMLGKSANYCRTDGSSEMYIMACDVSLGKTFETERDMFMDKPQPGTNSTHALSEIIPDPTVSHEIVDPDFQVGKKSDDDDDDDADETKKVVVPLGRPIKSSLPNRPSCDVSEFIVYDQRQVNIRYLLRLSTCDSTVAADGTTAAMPNAPNPNKGTKRRIVAAAASSTTVTPSSPVASAVVNNTPVASPLLSPAQKKSKQTVSAFIGLDKEDDSLPSTSGLKVLNCRTFVEGLRLTVVKGDITESKTDAIVVPTNANLDLTGMVGQKVKTVAGDGLQAEVDALKGVGSTQQATAPSNSGLPSNFTKIVATKAGRTIRQLATSENVPYLTPFYKVVKKENISATKDVICLEADGTFHRGNDARTFLVIPVADKASIVPAQIPTGAEVYVQSTSHTRKIPAKSAVLLETGATAVTAAAPSPMSVDLKPCAIGVVQGYNLPSSHVIFVVSPQAAQAAGNAEADLKRAVKNVLEQSAAMKLKTVTLPSIGSGNAGYDKGDAAAWIIGAIADYLEEASTRTIGEQTVSEICFCLYDDESLEAYKQGILAQEASS